RRRAALGHLPTLAELGEAEILHPHRLVPAERHVALDDVEVLARIGDAGLPVHVGRAVLPATRGHRVTPGEPAELGAHRGAVHPRRRLARTLPARLVS